MIQRRDTNQSFEEDPSRKQADDTRKDATSRPEQRTERLDLYGIRYQDFFRIALGERSGFELALYLNARQRHHVERGSKENASKESIADHSSPESQTHEDFSIARNGQRDMIIGGERYLFTPSDDDLREYSRVLEQAGLGMLEWRSSPVSGMALMEIPRDARTLKQVVTSVEGQPGQKEAIFGKFGQSLSTIAERVGKLPNPEDVDLGHVLYSRIEDNVILAPPIRFKDYNEAGVQTIENKIREQVMPEYRNFNGEHLFEAFQRGIE